MTRYFVSVLCAMMIVGATPPSHARDADGIYTVLGNISCGKYLDAYSRSTLDDDGYKGPHEFWEAVGWINGYISSYNEWTANGQKDIVVGLSLNDVRRWVASWCRDNPSESLAKATEALLLSRSSRSSSEG